MEKEIRFGDARGRGWDEIALVALALDARRGHPSMPATMVAAVLRHFRWPGKSLSEVFESRKSDRAASPKLVIRDGKSTKTSYRLSEFGKNVAQKYGNVVLETTISQFVDLYTMENGGRKKMTISRRPL